MDAQANARTAINKPAGTLNLEWLLASIFEFC